MKYVIDSDDYETILKNLKQVESIACLMHCSVTKETDEANVFWTIQDLVNYAKHLVQDSEMVRN